jgi:hypothetical protein
MTKKAATGKYAWKNPGSVQRASPSDFAAAPFPENEKE